jgi:hypothetical protein
MAKKGAAGGSIRSYFRKLFDENPKWVHEKSNNLIVARYRQDHGLGAEDPVEKRILSNLANLKSELRKKARQSKPGPKGPRAKVEEPAEEAVNSTEKALEALEVQIDDCMMAASALDRHGLGRVLDHLRTARNLVVWKLGKP